MSPADFNSVIIMPYTRNNIFTTTATCRRPVLTFKPVTTADIPLLRPLLATASTRSCDYTTGGIFMWSDIFDYKYCIVQGTLFIESLSEDGSGRTSFLVPVGAMPMERKIELLRDYCRRKDIPLLFTAVPEDMLEALTSGREYRTEELTDWADYIYDAESLATLTGKAYNKKRNHVNRFIADNPGYRLEPISSANIAELRRFFEGLGIESEKSDPAMAEFEWKRCADVIDNYDAYGFEGALLRKGDGRIAAFTMGEISGDTLVLHIEKIEHLVAGAGETINKLFAEHMLGKHRGIAYINREDDAGDPGLRQAKISYHPAYLLKKYNVELI